MSNNDKDYFDWYEEAHLKRPRRPLSVSRATSGQTPPKPLRGILKRTKSGNLRAEAESTEQNQVLPLDVDSSKADDGANSSVTVTRIPPFEMSPSSSNRYPVYLDYNEQMWLAGVRHVVAPPPPPLLQPSHNTRSSSFYSAQITEPSTSLYPQRMATLDDGYGRRDPRPYSDAPTAVLEYSEIHRITQTESLCRTCARPTAFRNTIMFEDQKIGVDISECEPCFLERIRSNASFGFDDFFTVKEQ